MLWPILFSWVTISIVISLIVTIGVSVMSMTPPDYSVAKGSFCFAALILTARVAGWLALERPPEARPLHTVLFAFVILGAIGAIWIAGLVWVDARRGLAKSVEGRKEVDSKPLKQKALSLAIEMALFSVEREKLTPGGAEQSARYHSESANLFVERFRDRIIEVREGLALYGLSDDSLEALAGPSRIFGPPYQLIHLMAGRIKHLAELLPSPESYKDVSNERLGELLLKQADKIQELTDQALGQLNNPHRNPENIRVMFTWDFQKCCKNALRELRGIAVHKLGLAMVDEDEVRSFQQLMSGDLKGTLAAAAQYLPHLRKLAEKLKVQK